MSTPTSIPTEAIELAQLVGQVGTLLTREGLTIEVHVLNAKAAYGVPRLLVSPAAGSGTAWVYLERVTLRGHPKPARR